jgi:uncharacterized RDD family membrane protein YckC
MTYYQPYPSGPGASPYTDPNRFLDGQELASWGSRLGAAIIDGLVVLPIGIAAGFPWVMGYFREQLDAQQHQQDVIAAGGQPDFFATATAGYGDLVVYTLIGFAIALTYHGGSLKLWQRTLGKRMLGLKVRRREADGPLSFGTIAKRLTVQFVSGLAALIPIVGSFVSMFGLLDGLWPLWDSKKQALHDKWAATNVVRA